MVIVPADTPIEVEAMALNRDIGFVHDGDPAEVEIDTFNFTKYGLLHGKVLGVSQDAILRDKPAGQGGNNERQPGQTARTSEPPGQELLYAVRVSLDQTRMQITTGWWTFRPAWQ
jgi:hemolysin D